LVVDSADLAFSLEEVEPRHIGAVEIGAVCADPGLRRIARQIEGGGVSWNDLRQPRWYELTLMMAAWLPVKTAEQFDAYRPAWMPPWSALTWYVECGDFMHLADESRRHPYVRKRLYPVERYALVAPYVTRTLALRLAEQANECACSSTQAFTVAVFEHEAGSHTPLEAEWLCASCAKEVDRRVRVIPLAGEWDRVFGTFGSRMMESQLEGFSGDRTDRTDPEGRACSLEEHPASTPCSRRWQREYWARVTARVVA
jgi:hypothetical protein